VTVSVNPNTRSALDTGSAFDIQGFDQLRSAARSTPDKALADVAKQFESVFLGMVLKTMRDSVPQDELFGSSSMKMYTSMFDQQLTQTLSGHGIGLADTLRAQLQRYVPGANADSTPAEIDHSTLSHPMPINSGAMPYRTQPLDVYRPWKSGADAEEANAVSPQFARARALYRQAVDPDTAGSAIGAASGGTVDDFVMRMGPAAQAASQASGVPPQLILAQAALESGWGRRELRHADGSTSHNLFGIKATPDWKGPTVQSTTTEFVNGVPQKTVAAFRAYGSYEEAFNDYARFLTRNPRYAQAITSGAKGDAEQAAHGLQRAGYATDPEYGNKLVRIMRQVS